MMYIPESVEYVINKLGKSGYSCFVVGGAVRDALRGAKVHDYDLCTSATPQQMHDVFCDNRVIDTGIKHGTITVLVQGEHIEITTFRIESEYVNSRKPKSVSFVTDVEKDLSRRDFTINAMAYAPDTGLIDLFGGKSDLENKIIRTVGNANERFCEDALRILRAIRFCSKLGFKAEDKTKSAIFENKELLLNISSERIASELRQILCGRYAGRVIREYAQVFFVILEHLKPIYGLNQKNPYHIYDVFEHSVRALEELEQDFVLRLSALYHDTGKAECMTLDENGVGHFYSHPKQSKIHAEDICRKLKLSNDEKERIIFLVEHHDIFVNDDKSIIKKRLAKYGESNFRQLIKLQRADSIGRGTHSEYLMHFISLENKLEEILSENHCISLKDLAVDGNDLIKLGLSGKQIGENLKKLLDNVMKYPENNTKQKLLDILKENIK